MKTEEKQIVGQYAGPLCTPSCPCERCKMIIQLPETKFEIIYADPPWWYADRIDGANRKFGYGASGHYPLMKDEEILALPVADIAADNAALFLWATCPRLDLAIEVVKAWGFDYKTVGFAWMKYHENGNLFGGPGNYTMSNVELCLLGIRGSMKQIDKGVLQAILEPRREHSRKPDCTRERINRLFGDRSRIELFARGNTDGWEVWGNEAQAEARQGQMF